MTHFSVMRLHVIIYTYVIVYNVTTNYYLCEAGIFIPGPDMQKKEVGGNVSFGTSVSNFYKLKHVGWLDMVINDL